MLDFGGAIVGVHVVSGTIAVLAGAAALAVRKGAATHIGAGRTFTIAMALSSAVGAALGLIRVDAFYITFHAGVLGVTLILGGWLTARMRSSRLTRASALVGVVNGLNTTGLVAAGAYALSLPEGKFLGFHAANYFFLSGMAGIAALGDISLIFRKALSDRYRIARHLWRMCLGFFIAAGSAFTGPGAKVFPEAVRSSGILSLPELIIIVLMLFWLGRTLLRRSPSNKAGAA